MRMLRRNNRHSFIEIGVGHPGTFSRKRNSRSPSNLPPQIGHRSVMFKKQNHLKFCRYLSMKFPREILVQRSISSSKAKETLGERSELKFDFCSSF